MAHRKKSSSGRVRHRQQSNSPSSRAWTITILFIIIFIAAIAYLNYYQKNHSLRKVSSNSGSNHLKNTQEPEFDFYTSLPSGQLTKVTNESPQTTEAKQNQNSGTNSNAKTSPSTTPKVITKHLSNEEISKAKDNISTYFLQVASFKNYQDADKLKAQLLLENFNVNVQKTQVKSQTWYRVITGPYYDMNALGKAQEQLKKLHYDSIQLKSTS